MSVSNILTLDQFKNRLIDDLKSDLKKCKSTLIIVGQETSLGILPINELSRKFLRVSGRLNQDIASFANSVSLVIAGNSITIK
jgi:adenosylcobinamide kinase/adenosylcobinamide-phosphate guanylyltransferase